MSLKLGGQNIQGLRVGDTVVNAAYLGSELVYSLEPPMTGLIFDGYSDYIQFPSNIDLEGNFYIEYGANLWFGRGVDDTNGQTILSSTVTGTDRAFQNAPDSINTRALSIVVDGAAGALSGVDYADVREYRVYRFDRVVSTVTFSKDGTIFSSTSIGTGDFSIDTVGGRVATNNHIPMALSYINVNGTIYDASNDWGGSTIVGATPATSFDGGQNWTPTSSIKGRMFNGTSDYMEFASSVDVSDPDRLEIVLSQAPAQAQPLLRNTTDTNTIAATSATNWRRVQNGNTANYSSVDVGVPPITKAIKLSFEDVGASNISSMITNLGISNQSYLGGTGSFDEFGRDGAGGFFEGVLVEIQTPNAFLNEDNSWGGATLNGTTRVESNDGGLTWTPY